MALGVEASALPFSTANPPDSIRTEVHPSIVFAPHLWLTALAMAWLVLDASVSAFLAPYAVLARAHEACASTIDKIESGCGQVSVDGTDPRLVAYSKVMVHPSAPMLVEALWWAGFCVTWVLIAFAALCRGRYHSLGLTVARSSVVLVAGITWPGSAGTGQLAWLIMRAVLAFAFVGLAQTHVSPQAAIMTAERL